jgi:hypothetical protein
VNNMVYALGGYNSNSKEMLNMCESYNIDTDEWKQISKMNIAKCAFAAAQSRENYIFTFGGFDGAKRLNIIERYDIKENKWAVMEVKMRTALSNSAATNL